MNWRTLFFLLAAFGAGFVASLLISQGGAAKQAVALQNSMLDYTAQSLGAQKAEADRVIAALAAINPEREATRESIQTIIKEVQSVPDSESCVRSPPVVAALERLRVLTETTTRYPEPGAAR